MNHIISTKYLQNKIDVEVNGIDYVVQWEHDDDGMTVQVFSVIDMQEITPTFDVLDLINRHCWSDFYDYFNTN